MPITTVGSTTTTAPITSQPSATGGEPPQSAAEKEQQLIDGYSRAPSGAGFDAMAFGLKGPKPEAKSTTVPAQGLTLATLPAGAKLVLGDDGRLGLGRPPKSLADELTALTTAAFASASFDQINDLASLRVLMGRLVQLHEFCCRSYPSTFRDDAVQARAAMLALAQKAATRSHALGTEQQHDEVVRDFIHILDAETHAPLKDFQQSAALRAFKAGALPGFESRAKAIDQSKPPYEKWDDDGVIRIHYVVDNDGTSRDSVLALMKKLGFKAEQNDDGTTLLKRKSQGGESLPVEIHLMPAPTPGENPPIFDRMADDDIDIVLYSGHAGYGQNVREAVSGGVQTDGAGKLIVLYQCSGIYNAEDIKAAFPLAQFTSTTTVTTDNTDMPMFVSMLHGFDKRLDWKQIHGNVQTDLKERLPDEDHSKLYFYPGQSEVSEQEIDRDKDGRADVRDEVFSLTRKVRSAALAVDATNVARPAQYLAAPALTDATGDLALVLRNNHMLTPAEEKLTPWKADVFSANGLFEPGEGDYRAFSLRYDATKKEMLVSLSTRYAHADGRSLARMLAVEAGQFFGEMAGLDAKATAALAMSMLERLEHQTARRFNQALDPMADSLFFARYGLTAKTRAALASLGDPDDFARKEYVKLFAALDGSTLGTPRSLSESLLNDATLRIQDEPNPDTLAAQLGLSGKLTPTSLLQGGHDYDYSYDYDAREHLELSHFLWEDGDKTKVVVMARDDQGYVTQLLAYPFDLTEAAENAVVGALASSGLKAEAVKEIQKAFLDGRAAGKGLDVLLTDVVVSTAARCVRDKEVLGGGVFSGLMRFFDDARHYSLQSVAHITEDERMSGLFRLLETSEPGLVDRALRATMEPHLDYSQPNALQKLLGGLEKAVKTAGTTVIERAGSGLVLLRHLKHDDGHNAETMAKATTLMAVDRRALICAEGVAMHADAAERQTRFDELMALTKDATTPVAIATIVAKRASETGLWFGGYESLTADEYQQFQQALNQ